MKTNIPNLSQLIAEQIKNIELKPSTTKEGKVLSVADDIVQLSGLSSIFFGEIIKFKDGSLGLVFSLERDTVLAAVLTDSSNIHEGETAVALGKSLEIPVGKEMIGRVINPLGEPLDGKGEIESSIFFPIESNCPGVVDRSPINEPLLTGTKSIDVLIPVGKGQRELIIGDRKTGKTQIAIDAIINQKGKNVKCIYVAIGQKMSSVLDIYKKLEQQGAMQYTTIMLSTAADSAAMQYISPYAGCALGEYFMQNGEDALIVYDDLTKHAWAYRQISLLIKRPPGREAYPGDVFFLHSRLLERSANVNEDFVERKSGVKGKGGSLTALPIIETQSGDISAFIPTNVISITDGQIFLESNLFNRGIKPAINIGNSVSRVGRAAQGNLIKSLSLGARLALAQYKELEAFSQLSTDLDEKTIMRLDKGKRTIEIFKQNPYKPSSVANTSILLFALNEGYLNDMLIEEIVIFQNNLQKTLEEYYCDFCTSIMSKNQIFSDEDKETSIKIILSCKNMALG